MQKPAEEIVMTEGNGFTTVKRNSILFTILFIVAKKKERKKWQIKKRAEEGCLGGQHRC